MIRVSNVTHHYGIRPVLKNLSMEVKTGDLVTVLGPNGMGKTTLLGVIAGALCPVAGEVEIDGVRRRSSIENERRIRRKVFYLADRAWLPTNRTGREFILAVGRLYGIDDLRLFDHADRLLRLFELTEKEDQPIASYSAGQKKKIALCAALITDAPYLLLDEPFSGGLDPSGILALKRVLQRLARQARKTVVMTTPVPEMVEELADRVAIIRNGELAAFDTIDDLRRQAGGDGPLGDVLQRILHPQTLENIEHYFQGESQ